jgi:hypothetical protein
MTEESTAKSGAPESSIAQRNERPKGWKPIRNVKELAERIDEDPWLEGEIKKDPRVVAAVFQPPLETDVWIYRIVVLALGIAVLASIGGAIYLVAIGKGEVPPILVALGSAAVGALAGLLAPSPARKID